MKKLYDLAVKNGSYTNNQGEEKGKYINVGAIVEKEDGGKFIFLDRTFNPAGVVNPDNRDNIIISMFKPKNKTESQPTENKKADESNFSDDDIPF